MFKHRVVTDEVRSKVLEALVPSTFPGVTRKDNWYNDQPYRYESWLIPTFCVVELDSDWLLTQEWWQGEFNNLDTPVYVIRLSCTGNSGAEYLLDKDFQIWHDTYMTPEVGIEYGASGPAFNGCYCSDSRSEVLEWIGELLVDMNKEGSHMWF